MEQTVKINQIISKTKIHKVSNGVNIFNHMISEVKKNNEINGFVLDFEGIEQCSVFVFKEIIRQMQARLNGRYNLTITNANPLIVQQYNLSFR